MGRPALDEPRSSRVSARCTATEKARFAADAVAAGLSEADLARRRLFESPSDRVEESEAPPALRGLERGPLGQQVAAELARESRPQTAWDRHQQNEHRKLSWFCPAPLCQEHGAKGARCPEHGVLMDVRGRA